MIKNSKWKLITLGTVIAGSFLFVTNSFADSTEGVPQQIADLQTLVSNQQKEIDDLKSTISQLGGNTITSTGTITIKADVVTSGQFDATTSSYPPVYTPIPGGKVTVMNSQGTKKWTGTIDSKGLCTFTLPEGIYSVRVTDSSPQFGDEWNTVTVSADKPATLTYEINNV